MASDAASDAALAALFTAANDLRVVFAQTTAADAPRVERIATDAGRVVETRHMADDESYVIARR